MSKTEIYCIGEIFVYFNANFNVFFKLIKVHLLVSELYVYQNARCNNKKKYLPMFESIGLTIAAHILLCFEKMKKDQNP